MALLDAEVEISVIELWLGHESIETLNGYLHPALAMNEEALAKVIPTRITIRRFRPDENLLAFLASLELC